MYLYCILAVEARDARAPQSHNWSYNQLKAALLLRLILWSFAARALEICKSQHLSPFSAQEQKRKIEDFRIVADYAFAISSFFCNYCVPAVSLMLLQRAKMLWSFCNGYKCYKAIYGTGSLCEQCWSLFICSDCNVLTSTCHCTSWDRRYISAYSTDCSLSPISSPEPQQQVVSFIFTGSISKGKFPAVNLFQTTAGFRFFHHLSNLCHPRSVKLNQKQS